MSLPASSLLDLWTAARNDTWAGCALRLAAAGREGSPDATALEPIGRTVAALLRLREDVADGALEATASCPECGEGLEFALPVADLLALESAVRADAGVIRALSGDLRLRVPGFADLDAVVAEPVAQRAEALARRCIVGEAPAQIDDADLAAIEAAVEAADPLVEVRVGLRCPECGTAIDADVDLVAHVWADVDARAHEVVSEVDALARAYGWGESEILALGGARRRLYLEHLGVLA